jgi:hypothetical protein
MYTYDEEANLYNLMAAGEDGDADEQVLAGDPDAVSGDAISDSNTVFVIANYNSKGAITGYTVKTGIKNIPDLKDAALADKSTVIYDTSIDWAVTYVDDDTSVEDGDGKVDLVLVLGAKQSSDIKYTASSANVEGVFYLLNTTPQKHFDLYNEYSVFMNGKETTLKVDVNAEGSADDSYDPQMTDRGFYKVVSWTGDYAYEIVPVEAAELASVGADVLSYSGGEDLWDYASCHDGVGGGDYIVKADNCKVYNLTDGKIAPIDVSELEASTNDGSLPTVEGVVAEWNEYGFATLIYYVVGD